MLSGSFHRGALLLFVASWANLCVGSLHYGDIEFAEVVEQNHHLAKRTTFYGGIAYFNTACPSDLKTCAGYNCCPYGTFCQPGSDYCCPEGKSLAPPYPPKPCR
jgi:hypothetical protein